ncbi:MAG: type II toxin-antitoxin system HicA family toxin [Terriglobia bacterium]
MEGLPSQLPWRDFRAVLTKLGYILHRSSRGSARTFHNPNREPQFVTFHEPHRPKTLPKGTLREYVRKLQLSPREFLNLLEQV